MNANASVETTIVVDEGIGKNDLVLNHKYTPVFNIR